MNKLSLVGMHATTAEKYKNQGVAAVTLFWPIRLSAWHLELRKFCGIRGLTHTYG
jgi:hypothetical protein